MNIQDVLKRVDNVKSESNYWFVRTDYGKYFDDFVKNKYIAIGWDYITLYDLKNSGKEFIKEKIAKVDKIDASTFGGRVKISTTYNKILTFISLKKDDIIIIPNKNSDKLAFGRIVDDNPFEENTAKEFVKRRHVEWYETKNMLDLNPIFYKVKSNQHAISNIAHYAPHIDRVIGILFTKEDKTHYVLNIEKTSDINFEDLQVFMSNIKLLIREINIAFAFNENLDELYVKISLQSKGSLELIKNGGKCLVILAFMFSLMSCKNTELSLEPEIQKFMDENSETLSKTTELIDSLKINIQKLTEPFVYNDGC